MPAPLPPALPNQPTSGRKAGAARQSKSPRVRASFSRSPPAASSYRGHGCGSLRLALKRSREEAAKAVGSGGETSSSLHSPSHPPEKAGETPKPLGRTREKGAASVKTTADTKTAKPADKSADVGGEGKGHKEGSGQRTRKAAVRVRKKGKLPRHLQLVAQSIGKQKHEANSMQGLSSPPQRHGGLSSPLANSDLNTSEESEKGAKAVPGHKEKENRERKRANQRSARKRKRKLPPNTSPKAVPGSQRKKTSGNAASGDWESLESEAGSAGPCLCLGMVYSEMESTGSQAMRDRPRLLALERALGYDVYTLDLTHDPRIAKRDSNGTSRHCNANWNASNRFFKTIWETWAGKAFSCVMMDYVRTPTGWTAHNIKQSFYRKTLPRLSTILAPEGRIFLPNSPGLYDGIKKSPAVRKKYFLRLVKPEENPLFRATRVAREALNTVTGYTNEGEVQKLRVAANTTRKLPFIMLTGRNPVEERKRIERAKERRRSIKRLREQQEEDGAVKQDVLPQNLDLSRAISDQSTPCSLLDQNSSRCVECATPTPTCYA
mmetsp:Transcript_15465/g.38075  ORF Transcript_15465/g.38075 Transcript_15465/m.38075 type:complete len:549 (-) Transcript_15465:232-1878(-)